MNLRDNYRTIKDDTWKGRVDDEDNYDAFRWHQIIEKIDLTKQNTNTLSKDEIGFCILGYNCDKGVEKNLGRIGTSKAPGFIRKEMSNLPCSFSKKIKIFDAGNIFPNTNDSLSFMQSILAVVVTRIIELNLFPIVLGGGHEIALGHFNGIISSNIFQADKEKELGIINLDAHFDLRPYKKNGASSGSMFLQIADFCENQKHIDFSYFCLGESKLFSCAKTINEKRNINIVKRTCFFIVSSY